MPFFSARDRDATPPLSPLRRRLALGVACATHDRLPQTSTVGAPDPINQFTDLLRDEVARAGYVEMLTHGLCSRHDNFGSLRRPEPATPIAVELLNPANEEYQVVRTTLLPGALKTLAHNKRMATRGGVRLFEISDVVLLDAAADVGARNRRRLLATHTGLTAGFEVRGLEPRARLRSTRRTRP